MDRSYTAFGLHASQAYIYTTYTKEELTRTAWINRPYHLVSLCTNSVKQTEVLIQTKCGCPCTHRSIKRDSFFLQLLAFLIFLLVVDVSSLCILFLATSCFATIIIQSTKCNLNTIFYPNTCLLNICQVQHPMFTYTGSYKINVIYIFLFPTYLVNQNLFCGTFICPRSIWQLGLKGLEHITLGCKVLNLKI